MKVHGMKRISAEQYVAGVTFAADQRSRGVPRNRFGYEVLRLGTNGLPANTRAMASIAPRAFLRAVEM